MRGACLLPPEDRQMWNLSFPFRPCEFQFCLWIHSGPSSSGKTRVPQVSPYAPYCVGTCSFLALVRSPCTCPWHLFLGKSSSLQFLPSPESSAAHRPHTPGWDSSPSFKIAAAPPTGQRKTERPRAFSHGSKLTYLFSPLSPAQSFSHTVSVSATG